MAQAFPNSTFHGFNFHEPSIEHARDRARAAGGTFMLVEPFAGDNLEENTHHLGQIYYSFSTMICVPASHSQEVRLGLGVQAGQKRLTEVLNEGGLGQVRRAAARVEIHAIHAACCERSLSYTGCAVCRYYRNAIWSHTPNAHIAQRRSNDTRGPWSGSRGTIAGWFWP